MGTPEFAATVLDGLIEAGHAVRAVYTQPPRPAGRGHRLRASPVQLAAERHRLAMRCPTNLRSAGDAAGEFAALGVDAAVVAAYGLILPPAMLTAPRLGCLNVHASLLPRWRGAAPIQRALLAGDSATGITIMQMDEGLDTGAILMQQALPIEPDTTAAGLIGRARRARRPADRRRARRSRARPPRAAPAAAARHHLRAQDRRRRGPARLATLSGRSGAARARVRPVAGRFFRKRALHGRGRAHPGARRRRAAAAI